MPLPKWVLPLATGIVPALANAQTVRGTVAEFGTDRRLGGAVVQLLDSSQNDRGRALTNERGAFVLRAPAPGRYRLVAHAIGFRPSTTASFSLLSDTTVAFTLSSVATVLSQVRTFGRNPCNARPDTASPVWALWDQATTAMLATAINLGDREKQFRFVLSRRVYELFPPALTSIEFRETALVGARPWASMEPDSLAMHGYLVFSDSGVTYWAPDLEVMLSRSFANTHCFQIHRASKNDPTLVGVDFAPAPGIKHADIEGTFWLDLASRELRSLAFTYANLEFTKADTLAGGRVQFMRLPTGEWTIPDWVIRAPAGFHKDGASEVASMIGRVNDVAPRLPKPTAVGVKRGELLDVRASADSAARPTWSRATNSLRIRVAARDGRNDVPQAGVVVRLPESTRQAVSDSAGMVRFDGLIEGDYVVEVAPLAYDMLSELPVRSTMTLALNDSTVHAVRVASAEQAIVRACGPIKPSPTGATRGLLIGRISRDGVPEEGASVTAVLEPDPDYKRAVMAFDPTKAIAMKPDSVAPVRTSAAGTFTMCGAPHTARYTHLRVYVTTKDGAKMSAELRFAEDQLYAWVDIPVTRP